MGGIPFIAPGLVQTAFFLKCLVVAREVMRTIRAILPVILLLGIVHVVSLCVRAPMLKRQVTE